MYENELVKNIKKFMKENDKSLVTYGALVDGGIMYRLENGRSFKLNSQECRYLPSTYPKWFNQ